MFYTVDPHYIYTNVRHKLTSWDLTILDGTLIKINTKYNFRMENFQPKPQIYRAILSTQQTFNISEHNNG